MPSAIIASSFRPAFASKWQASPRVPSASELLASPSAPVSNSFAVPFARIAFRPHEASNSWLLHTFSLPRARPPAQPGEVMIPLRAIPGLIVSRPGGIHRHPCWKFTGNRLESAGIIPVSDNVARERAVSD